MKRNDSSYLDRRKEGNDCIIETWVYRGYEYEVITSQLCDPVAKQHQDKRNEIDQYIGKQKGEN